MSIPNSTSIHLKDLLIKMLKRNPTDRINFEDFFTHKFLVEKNDHGTDQTVMDSDLEFSGKNSKLDAIGILKFKKF